MAQIIPLQIRAFAKVKHARSRGSDATMDSLLDSVDLRWINQIRSLRIEEPTDPKVIAELIIELGANLSYSNIWECFYDGTHLCKLYRNKKVVCQFDLVKQDNLGNLHCDDGAAVVSGEDKFYFLHGLELRGQDTKWLTYPAEQLDPQEILAIRNVDLRREMIRKKGTEQLLDGLFHRVLDTQGNYSLLAVMLGNDTHSACNFLKMLNPSIGVWHMEGVPNNIRTVRDALLWRNNGWFEHAEKIT